MYKIIIILIITLTLFIIKPFINGLGCDFKINNENQVVKYSITCNNGLVLSDFYDKKSETRTIRRSFYGYWGGYVYNIPFYQSKYITSTSGIQSSISKLSKYEISTLWSVYLIEPSNENISYSFLNDKDGTILASKYIHKPNYGFIK